jgi:hypothetical protein
MNYEVLEDRGQWIVRCDGVELARFGEQLAALADVADRLRERETAASSYSLTMRYQPRS